MNVRQRVFAFLLILTLPLLLVLLLGPVAAAPQSVADNPEPDPRQGGTNLTFVERFGGTASAVALQGNTAYVGLDNNVVIVDVTDLAAPVRQGQFSLSGSVRSIAVAGSYVFAASDSAQLQVIDVTNPDAPANAGAWSAAAPIWTVTVANDIAYLALGAAGLQLLDVANPLNPQPLGTFPAGQATQRARAVNDRAYVADTDGFLYILNVADPNNPTQLGSYDLGGPVADVRVIANTAFISWSDCGGGGCDAMYTALNVTLPATPSLLRTRLLGEGAAASLAVSGGYAYVSRYDPSGVHQEAVLTVLDVSVPQFSNIVSAFDSPGAYGAFDVVVSGVRALVANREAGLQLLNVSDPLGPDLTSVVGGPAAPLALAWSPAGDALLALSGDAVGEGALWGMTPADDSLHTIGVGVVPGLKTAVDLAVAGDYAYAVGLTTAGSGFLTILDADNPETIVALGQAAIGVPQHVAAAGNVAVVHDDSGLRIFNVANPAAPVQVNTRTPAGDVAMAGSLALVATGGPGLQLLDLSQPAFPILLGTYNPTWNVNGVALLGDYAVVGRSSGGIAVIDVSSPTNPQLVSELAGAWSVTHLTAAGDYVLVTTASSVLNILLTDPSQPKLVGSYSTSGVAMAAANAGQVYLATNTGLSLLTQQYRLAGQVQQANGLPWAGATIYIDGDASGTSGGNGTFTVNGLDEGAYTVTAGAGAFAFWPAQLMAEPPPDVLDLSFTILAAPISTTVTAGGGGQLTSVDPQGLATVIDVPPGAVLTDTTLLLTPIVLPDEAGYGFAAHGFDLTAYQGGAPLPEFEFAQPVTLTIPYSEADIAGLIEPELVIWWGDTGDWADATTSCAPPSTYDRDLAGNSLGVGLCATGRFGLFGPQQSVYLPIVQRAP